MSKAINWHRPIQLSTYLNKKSNIECLENWAITSKLLTLFDDLTRDSIANNFVIDYRRLL